MKIFVWCGFLQVVDCPILMKIRVQAIEIDGHVGLNQGLLMGKFILLVFCVYGWYT